MATQLSVTDREPANENSVDSEPDLLELLGDEYTRRVLAAVTEQPRSGSEVVEAADVSKATAYRRLGELEDAGLVDSEMVFDPDGHHHEQFYAIVESIDMEFGADGVSFTVRTAGSDTDDVSGITHRI
ncbi:ArsR/SmtB family transcription factor [Halovenus sp. HT40]|uniref:ArsR/SmtB family transcription factor n=1 Tax=Halovenus sp. HT40 TaxID=3126691 RepID=UPI00300F0CB5